MSTERVAFKPRARLLQLLGDQLIGSGRLAVFELVKNAYDADATEVTITMDGIRSGSPRITVQDDGTGMTVETVRDVWFVPGHDHKKKQRDERETTKKGRMPLGEKGVGRFAAHKLGEKIELVTKAKGCQEVVVSIDWAHLMKSEFLSDARVTIKQREPEVFRGKSTGTVITIGDLKDKEWTRGDLRRLNSQITSICSPFGDGPDEFHAELIIPEYPEYIEGMASIVDIMKKAIWVYEFSYDGEKFEWEYKFSPPKKIGIEGRKKSSKKGEKLLIPLREFDASTKKRGSVTADDKMIQGIGPIVGKIYVFDRDRDVLKLVTESSTLTKFLNENGGVRVYRDGMRVYNYGERDDDWLGLDLRRVNTPTVKISRNIVVGMISLRVDESHDLEEKTNREGFIENDAFGRLRSLVRGSLSVLETERRIDKDAIRKATASPRDLEAQKVKRPVEKLRQIAKEKNVDEAMEPYIKRLEKDYESLRDSMLQAGISGLGLATVFHEVLHGVRSLHDNIKSGAPIKQVRGQAEELVRLLDGISALLRKGPKKDTSVADLVRKARTASLIRFKSHGVKLVSPFLEDEKLDFVASIPSQLFVGVLTNLLDNAFYWTRVRWSAKPADIKKSNRQIYIGRSDDFELGPALIIADTGPGFEDDPENLVQPFFTRRPDGMGLGLYYANMVMDICGGELLFPDADDVDIPPKFTGAIIALVFPRK